MKFYKRDPDRALAGMAELSLEERGAYNTIIDALYARDGVLRDDDELLRRIMGCHGNQWRKVKTSLLEHGKIWIEAGYIKAKGVDSVLKEAENFSETQRKRAEKRWEIENKTGGKTEKHQQNQHHVNASAAYANTPTPIETSIETAAASVDPLSFGKEMRELAGLADSIASQNFQMVPMWLQEGLDPELDIRPAITAAMEGRRQRDPNWAPRGLSYFTDIIREWHANRVKGLPPRDSKSASAPAKINWTDAVNDYVWMRSTQPHDRTNWWSERYGPAPHEPGCQVPESVYERVARYDAEAAKIFAAAREEAEKAAH